VYVVLATPSTTLTVIGFPPPITKVKVPSELTLGYPLNVGFTYATTSTCDPRYAWIWSILTSVGTLFTTNVLVTGLVTWYWLPLYVAVIVFVPAVSFE